MDTTIIRIPSLSLCRQIESRQGSQDRLESERKALNQKLRKEASHDILFGVTLTVVCILPLLLVKLTNSIDYFIDHSKLTLLLFLVFVILAMVGFIRLLLTPWLIGRRLLRPRLSTIEQSLREYFGNLQATTSNSISYACLTSRSRQYFGNQKKFNELWRQVIEEFKRINGEYVEAGWPERYRVRMLPMLEFDVVELTKGRDSYTAVVRLSLNQFYEYEYGFDGPITDYLEGPVRFELHVRLVQEDREWHLDNALPDLGVLIDTVALSKS